jgi:excisionase family DNA binding protein
MAPGRSGGRGGPADPPKVRASAAAFSAGPLPAPPLAYGIGPAAEAAGVGRDTLYRAIGRGELTARKVGARTVILADELKRWLAALPAIKPRRRAAPLAPTRDLP